MGWALTKDRSYTRKRAYTGGVGNIKTSFIGGFTSWFKRLIDNAILIRVKTLYCLTSQTIAKYFKNLAVYNISYIRLIPGRWGQFFKKEKSALSLIFITVVEFLSPPPSPQNSHNFDWCNRNERRLGDQAYPPQQLLRSWKRSK